MRDNERFNEVRAPGAGIRNSPFGHVVPEAASVSRRGAGVVGVAGRSVSLMLATLMAMLAMLATLVMASAARADTVPVSASVVTVHQQTDQSIGGNGYVGCGTDVFIQFSAVQDVTSYHAEIDDRDFQGHRTFDGPPFSYDSTGYETTTPAPAGTHRFFLGGGGSYQPPPCDFRDTTQGRFSNLVVTGTRPPPPTTTAASASPSASESGESVKYSATVSATSGSDTPTGTVDFTVGRFVLCTAPLSAGVASCSTTNTPIGKNTVTATYSGDGAFAGSSGTTTAEVVRAAGLSVSDVSVAEPPSGSAPADFKVTLSKATSKAVTVQYATQDGTGSGGAMAAQNRATSKAFTMQYAAQGGTGPDGATAAENDYTATTGSLTFAPGETEKTVSVPVNHVGKAEPNETFTLELSGESNAAVDKRVGVATITSPRRLAGRVVDRKGDGLAGVRVAIAGPESRTVLTSPTGDFSTELEQGTYTVAPQGDPPGRPPGGVYEPKNSADCTAVLQSCRVNLNQDRSVSFAYGFKLPISGAVDDTSGKGLAGVTVQVTGTDSEGRAVNLKTTTDAGGKYSQLVDPGSYAVSARGDAAGVPAGATYAVKDCSGQRRQSDCTVTVDTKPQTADFVAACKTELTFGPVQALSACFKKEDPKSDVVSSEGPVRVNGLDLTASGKIKFDPKKGTVSSSGPVTIKAGDAVLYTGPLKLSLTPKLELPVGGQRSVKGFPIKGNVKLTLVLGKTSLDASVGLPKLLGGATGDVSFSTDNTSGLKLDSLKVKVGEATLKGFGLKDVSVAYEAAKDEWSGGAKLLLPSAAAAKIDISGKAAFQKGSLASASAEIAVVVQGVSPL